MLKHVISSTFRLGEEFAKSTLVTSIVSLEGYTLTTVDPAKYSTSTVVNLGSYLKTLQEYISECVRVTCCEQLFFKRKTIDASSCYILLCSHKYT